MQIPALFSFSLTLNNDRLNVSDDERRDFAYFSGFAHFPSAPLCTCT